MTTDQALREANARWMRRRNRLIGYGQWQPFVDAAKARAHMEHLRHHGLGLDRIRTLSGVSIASIELISSGRRQRIRPETEQRILSVQPSLEALADGALMDACGTIRRLQALVAVGWPPLVLAARLSINATYLNVSLRGERKHVTCASWKTTKALYDELWDIAPETHGVTANAKSRAMSRAKGHGWLTPAAWDDDHIDDPTYTPDLGDDATCMRIDVEHLLSCGVATSEVQARTGASIAYVREIAAELRTGKPRDRSRQTDMRKAA